MACLTTLQPSAIFSFFPNPSSNLSSSSLYAAPPLKIAHDRFPHLGFCAKRARRGDVDGSKLEDEIYEFMARSKKPSAFPTRGELIEAGRGDLADAITQEGGWFTLGWNVEENQEEEEEEEEEEEIGDGRSSNERSMEVEVGDGVGIEGILSRLEKERSLAFGVASLEKQVNGRKSCGDGDCDRADDGEFYATSVTHDDVLIANEKAVVNIDRSRASRCIDLDEELFHKLGGIHSHKETTSNANGMSTAPMWRIWSLQRAGNPETEFEAAEVVSNGERSIDNHDFNGDDPGDDNAVAKSASRICEQSKGSNTDAEDICQTPIHLRLKHLESELASSLRVLRSRSTGVVSDKEHESSLGELHRISDELEFNQTEIMNAKATLRSMRAKLAVLRGKMTNAIIEEQKMMDERKKRLDAAQKALGLLHSVCIVWPNSASEVLLAGSFDGWTNQRKMERSKEGIFTLHLKLYPGRYEFKFIVDGVWMIDPLRPTVCNNGYKNNLLIVT